MFPTQKYRLIRDELLRRGTASRTSFVEAPPAAIAALLRVHTKEYLEDFLNCRATFRTVRSELPLRPDILDAYTCGAQATILATEDALRSGIVGINIGGGFHHAFADHAEGFCYLNDLAIAARHAQHSLGVGRVLIVDLDVHQGNGTAHIFSSDPSVVTFSIHQENNYPLKQQSDVDVGLDDGVGDEEYLAVLSKLLNQLLDEHSPDLVLYAAGADPYQDDQLGGLCLTVDGLRRRDEMVFAACTMRRVPVVVTLAGGYARQTHDTVLIHTNTIALALQLRQ